ncbi:MAG: NAD-dependent epimerase/dehydratase family protein [Halioglobus sp.]|nr:NAD-dependent epimerase/dehydratase family protein [Halioglobus sp.]
MNCLVTGASGFVGRQLCRQLARRGHTVTALSRAGGALADGRPTFAHDLCSADLDSALLRGVDVVFHLAGIAHRRADRAVYEQLNHLATAHLARQAAAAGVGRFVFLSSVKAMGAGGGHAPRAELDCTPPTDAYGRSKWRAETALRQTLADSAMSVVIVRPALVYGAGVKGNLARLVRAVARGLPRPPPGGARAMLAIDDLVTLLCLLGADAPPGVHTWIACDDEGYSTRYVYDLLREAGGRGRGRAWLPPWGWRLAAAALDARTLRGGDESTYSRLFGADLYSSAAVQAATGWRPRCRLREFAAAVSAGDGGGPG